MANPQLQRARRPGRRRFWTGIVLTVIGGAIAAVALVSGLAANANGSSPVSIPTPSSSATGAASGTGPEQAAVGQTDLNNAVGQLDYLIQFSESNGQTGWFDNLSQIKTNVTNAQTAFGNSESADSGGSTTPPDSSSSSSSGGSPGLVSVTSFVTTLAGVATAIIGLMTAIFSWRQAKSKEPNHPSAPAPYAA